MRMMFKQRFFSWLDSYDIFDAEGRTLFEVVGKLSFGHKLDVNDAQGNSIGTIQEEIFTFLPRYNIIQNNHVIGTIKKEFTFFKPLFTVDFNGWRIEGDYFEWDYSIIDGSDRVIATVSKQFFNWTDTYLIDVENAEDCVMALMVVLAIDVAKCSSD